MKNLKTRIALWSSILLIGSFFAIKTTVVFDLWRHSEETDFIEYGLFVSFLIPFMFFLRDFLSRKEKLEIKATQKNEIAARRLDAIDQAAAIVEFDRDTRITHANQAFCELVERWDLVGTLHYDIMPEDLRDRPSYQEFWDSLRSGHIRKGEFRRVTATGKTIWIIGTYLPIKNTETGEIDKIIKVVHDNTSLHLQFKKIERLQSDLNEINDFINESTLVSRADAKGKITYVNRKFEEVSGWKSEELIGKDHNILNSGFHGKDFWKEMYKVTVKDKLVWNQLVTNKAKDGSLYYVDSYIKAIFDPLTDKLTGFISIRQDQTSTMKALTELDKKNTYLEHAAKILRHDMHSGINTYIPRGIKSLERRLDDEMIRNLKIEAPLKMIKGGLQHTQKVYQGVYEFSNLVKKNVQLEKKPHDLKKILEDYLAQTSYRSSVIIDDLPTVEVNESLFCTAIDNLIRNGLKYNDDPTKLVKIYMEEGENRLVVEDNGRGMSQEEFEQLSKPYIRRPGQKEGGTGLGLNICIAILREHGFSVSAELGPEKGTRMLIACNCANI